MLAVLGPFNFPGHLPNGHIVPALAGNTVVFKPSEMTPLVGQPEAELWQAAGLPAGVLNLVQGAATPARRWPATAASTACSSPAASPPGGPCTAAFADCPQKILALEMGGNNPLIVTGAANIDAAAYATVLSAYLTAGQRCTLRGD